MDVFLIETCFDELPCELDKSQTICPRIYPNQNPATVKSRKFKVLGTRDFFRIFSSSNYRR